MRTTLTDALGITAPKPIADQIRTLAARLGLDPDPALAFARDLPEIPRDTEGWFAFASVDGLARRHFPQVTDPAERHCRAVRIVLNQVNETCPIDRHDEKLYVPARIRRHELTARCLDQVNRAQPGEIVIYAAQLGQLRRGRRAELVRRNLDEGEFGLDSVAVGSVVLTHPDPESWWKRHTVNCLGEDFDPGSQGRYTHTPFFLFSKGQCYHVARWIGDDNLGGGSATGFVPR